MQIYSGRADPIWDMPVETGQTLESIWELLPHYSEEYQEHTILGYSGCKLLVENGIEFLAYNGVVARSQSGKIELRKDLDRRFEKLIFFTAPPGIVPEEVTGF